MLEDRYVRRFELVREIFDEFGHDDFSWHEVLKFLEHHAAWGEINRHMDQRKV